MNNKLFIAVLLVIIFNPILISQENNIKKCIILNNYIHKVERTDINNSIQFKRCHLDSLNNARITDSYIDNKSEFYRFPISWYVNDSNYIAISSVFSYKKDIKQFTLDNIKQEKNYIKDRRMDDSMTTVNLVKKYPNIEERRQIAFKNLGDQLKIIDSISNSKKLFPLYYILDYYKKIQNQEYIEELLNKNISFDFICLGNNSYELYVRDHKYFTCWQFTKPIYGIKDNPSDWKELYTLSSDSSYFGEYFNKLQVKMEVKQHIEKDSYFYPSKKNSILASIKDSLFFVGHFKMIIQNEKRFIINQKHGTIYYLNSKELIKIGKIIVSYESHMVCGNRYFIDDRDNNQIIFIDSVDWFNNDLKPRYEIINKEAFEKKYGEFFN